MEAAVAGAKKGVDATAKTEASAESAGPTTGARLATAALA